MPRLLTIWLDFGATVSDQGNVTDRRCCITFSNIENGVGNAQRSAFEEIQVVLKCDTSFHKPRSKRRLKIVKKSMLI